MPCNHHSTHFQLRLTHLLLISASAALLAFSAMPAGAKGFKVIYAFCARGGICVDGKEPMSSLVTDAAGNLYGTTFEGGASGSGTVYQLSPNAGKTKWTQRVIYSFCTQAGCTDGEFPSPAGLIIDARGNLYGTAPSGGADNGGVVFKLSPKADGRIPWTLTVLHNFCGSETCADGNTPWAGLTYAGASSGSPYDGVSPLYGTTYLGGSKSYGTAYALTPGKYGWTERVLYTFCSQANCADGAEPDAPLTLDAKGNFYGTTSHMAQNDSGTVFQLSKRHGQWSQTVLYSFCPGGDCTDGKEPSMESLQIDAAGALMGTTERGGANDGGTLFRLTPNGSRSQMTRVASFCAKENCEDGALPSGLVLHGTAAYGTLASGGVHFGGYASGAGGVYTVSGGKVETVHMFCTKTNCRDGAQPIGGLMAGGRRALYGTASAGGPHNSGVVFEVTP